MAVGEEAVLRRRSVTSRTSSNLAINPKNFIVLASMMLMGFALVVTLSHVSAGARFYGLQQAKQRSALTQKVRPARNTGVDNSCK
jgi:hypothetical protein